MSGGDDQLRIILDDLARLTGQPPPPQITPDQLAEGNSAISQLLRLLGVAANSGDPADSSDALDGHAERDAKTADALAKFPANEEASSARLAGISGQDPMAQMVQQIPQMASGLAGGIAGALGGVLQPLAQIPQQIGQMGQQALQAGMGALQHSGGAAEAGEVVPAELAGTAGGPGELGGAGVGGGALGATTPTAMLGPLPAPSPGTEPASSHSAAPAPPGPPAPTTAARGAMGAMPMMPPGAMQGGSASANDAKPDTKRIVAPTVKNGAPVQGRIVTPPPLPEVVKRVEGKPIATRRILLPKHTRDDDDGDPSR